MDIKVQLIANNVAETLINNVDADKIADTEAINMLLKIQEIIKDNNLTVFDVMDKIVILLKQNGFDTGNRLVGRERWFID